jgi:hypothetical protein
MKLTSHQCWFSHKAVIGKRATWQRKIVKDVVVSPNGNAYALVFEDGTIYDMTSYDSVDIFPL